MLSHAVYPAVERHSILTPPLPQPPSQSHALITMLVEELENVKVKVAAQRALVSFLLSIEDQAILGQFKSLTQQILDVTVEALKADQTLGQ